MSAVRTPIQWTDATWNPVRGCSRVSPGCTNCYAMRQAHRFSGKGQAYEGLTRLTARGPVWTGAVRAVPAMLCQPLHWMRPRRVFVNSMSDLFHESLPDDFIRDVFSVMASCGYLGHVFQVLTKRPERMRDLVSRLTYLLRPPLHGLFELQGCDRGHLMLMQAWWKDELDALITNGQRDGRLIVTPDPGATVPKVAPNIWLGVSVENQETADERIPLLLRTPAAIRFLSVEPLLGPVDLTQFQPFRSHAYPNGSADSVFGILGGAIAWVIVGGESGPGARPMDLAWARSVVEQCQAAGVPCFVKQLGTRPMDVPPPSPGGRYAPGERPGQKWQLLLRDRKGGDLAEWPSDLRVRQFPGAPGEGR